jgi:hypothetical protein
LFEHDAGITAFTLSQRHRVAGFAGLPLVSRSFVGFGARRILAQFAGLFLSCFSNKPSNPEHPIFMPQDRSKQRQA